MAAQIAAFLGEVSWERSRRCAACSVAARGTGWLTLHPAAGIARAAPGSCSWAPAPRGENPGEKKGLKGRHSLENVLKPACVFRREHV